jgi:sulfur relay (sulfurtransferase) complex TusBCD TusD component (DsrE family)
MRAGLRSQAYPRAGIETLAGETIMSKTLTIILWTSPYGSEHAYTALRIAETALTRGYRVTLHATGDGVHGFTVGQGAKGLPHVESISRRLMAGGLNVDL